MKKMTQKIRRGSALLISIIVTSSLLIVGVEVSMFVVSTIRQARSIDQTLQATYAAESGVESALHQIRKEGPFVSLRSDIQTSSSLYTATASDPSWTFKKDTTIDPFAFSATIDKLTKSYIGEQEGVDIHLYATTDAGFSIVTSSMATMVVEWKDAQCAAPGDIPVIEVTAVSWPISGTIVQWNPLIVSIQKNFSSPATGIKTVTVPLSSLIPAGDRLGEKGLTLRVKPFYCSLRGVTISFPDSTDASKLVPTPNYYRIAPVGIYGGIRKQITVLVTQKAGTAGIFDFVLFSDEKMNKQEQ